MIHCSHRGIEKPDYPERRRMCRHVPSYFVAECEIFGSKKFRFQERRTLWRGKSHANPRRTFVRRFAPD
jgi:hypothetical protein